MAELPIYTQKYGASGQRASAADMGAIEGQAKQQFGRSLQNAGSDLYQITSQRKEAEDLEKAKQTASETRLVLQEEIQKARLGAAEDGTDHAATVEQLIKDSWSLASEGFSGKALEYLNDKSRSFTETFLPPEFGFEAVKKGEQRQRIEQSITDSELNSIRTNPSLVTNTIGEMMERVSGYTYSKDNPKGVPEASVVKIIQSNKNAYYNAAVEGIIDQTETISQLDELEKEYKSDVWQDRLTSGDYEANLKAIDAKRRSIEAKNQVNLSQVKQQTSNVINDYLAYTLSGRTTRRPNEINKENLTLLYGEDKADEILVDVNRTESLLPLLSTVGFGTPSEAADVMNYVESQLSSPDDFRDKAQLYKHVYDAYAARANMVQTKPAEYVMNQSDELRTNYTEAMGNAYTSGGDVTKMQSATTELVNNQLRLGTLSYNIQAVTPEEVTYFEELFKGVMTKEGEAAVDAIEQLRQAKGSYFDIAINNLVESKSIPSSLGVIANIPNRTNQGRAIEALRNFSDLKQGHSYDEYDTTGSLLEYSRTTPSTIFAGSSDDISAVSEVTNALALLNIKEGVSNPVSSAVDQVINSRYDFYGTIRLPKQVSEEVGSEVSFVRKLNEMYSNFDQYYGEQIDWSKINTAFDISPDEVRNQFSKAISAGKVSTYTTPDDRGLMFVSNTGAPLLGVDGHPFVVEWDDLRDLGYTGVRKPVRGR